MNVNTLLNYIHDGNTSCGTWLWNNLLHTLFYTTFLHKNASSILRGLINSVRSTVHDSSRAINLLLELDDL